MSSRRPLLIFLGFLGLSALFYAPHLLGLRTFPDGDFTHHFLPFSLFQSESIRAAQLPLWNPYTYSGHPFLADIQAAVFYPLSNFFILLEIPFTDIGSSASRRLYLLQLEAASHVALAGFFVYLLVFELTRKQKAAIVAGCIFAFSGYLTGYPPQQLAVLRTAIWLPLIMWLLLRAFAAPSLSRWWVGAAGAISIAFLAGHPQTFLHIGYSVSAWIILLLWIYLKRAPSKRAGSVFQVIFGLIGFVFVAFGLSAAQLLPTLEFTQQSVRADVGYDFVSGGFPLRDTWQMLLPWVFTHFSPLYIGTIGLGLAVCSVGIFERKTSKRNKDRASQNFVLFFLIMTLLALLLSYGENGFLYRLFYHYAPGWKLFRGQERAAFLVAFGLSVLGGIGFGALPTMPLPRRRLLVAFFTVLMIGAVYGFGLLWQFSQQSALSNGAYILIAILTLLLVMTFSVSTWLPGWSNRRGSLLLGLLVANLFLVNVWTNVASFGPERKTILAPEMEGLQQAVHDSAGQNAGLPGRVYNEYRIYEDAGMRLQTEDVWGSSPLRLASYAALFDEFPLDRMWQLAGVEHVLTWRKELFVDSELLAEYPQSADTTYLHRLAEPNPRAWVVHQARIVEDGEALQLLADHSFDLTKAALLAPSSANVAFDGAVSTNVESSVRLTRVTVPPPVGFDRLSPRGGGRLQLRVMVESSDRGLLFISENWMQGWHITGYRCTDDGNPCLESGDTSSGVPSILRANLAFLGVPIEKGKTEFDLIYRPQSVVWGLQISGTTLLLLALCAIGRWRYTHSKGIR